VEIKLEDPSRHSNSNLKIHDNEDLQNRRNESLSAEKNEFLSTSESEELVRENLESSSKFTEFQKNSMRELKIGKIVVNISVGKSGDPLEKAITILKNLTEQRPCIRRAKQTIRTFGIRKNEPISCMVTLRKTKADTFLRKALRAKGNWISPRSFDRNGNFAFGIKEHIDIEGQRYYPNLGIVGMDVMVTVERPGFRVARRKRARSKIGNSHRVTKEESIEFVKNIFGVEVNAPVE